MGLHSQEETQMTSHARENVQDNLKRLHDTNGLLWTEIALMWPYLDFAPGTLSAIANGTCKVPHKFRARFSNCQMDSLSKSDLLNALEWRVTWK